MKKIIGITVLFFALTSCGNSTTTVSDAEVEAHEEYLEWIWKNYFTARDRAVTCNVYFTAPKEEVIEMFTAETPTDPDPMSEVQALVFYDILNKECG